MDEEQLEAWIKKDEGLNLHYYIDTTGHGTIGWGRDIQDCGIRIDEAELMFQNDFKQTKQELEQHSWYTMQPQGVQFALINMNFNLGITKLLEFTGMINALEQKNYVLAAKMALDSLWAKQVHDRANQIALMIREGK
jgi:lysozyme